MQGSRTGVKPFVLAMRPRVVGRRGVRRVNAGAEGINRRQFFAPDGDSDVPSGFAKNGGAHLEPRGGVRWIFPEKADYWTNK